MKPRLFTRRTNSNTNGSGWDNGVAYEILEDAHGKYLIDSHGHHDYEHMYNEPFQGVAGWQLFWLMPDGTELEALE
jgi:hypothetical protein